MLGVSSIVLRACQLHPSPDTYDEWVESFAPKVVSYWKFEDSGADEKGTQNASITGSPELNVETIVDLDTIAEGAADDGKCIAWPGTSGVYAEAAHNAAHKTPEGTIIVTFQRDTASQKCILLAADANSAPGGLSVEVTVDGSPRAFLRRQSDGAPVILLGQAGDVALSEAYTLIIKWGTGGLSLALWDAAGALVRRVTDALTDGVTGSSPIRFGAWHTGVDPHDGPYGRVVWLDRRITDGEETILARARTIAHGPPPGELTQLGAWPLSETSGNTFADTIGGNTATLSVPSWTVATHEHNRRGIVSGTDHALEVSNGGPAIPMAAGYKQSAMSLVLYVEPRSELRGTQYWSTSDERHGREFIAYCDDGSTPGAFAIYRRRFSATEWRLGGYVRDSGGTKQYFGGSLSGISGALLPVDTAKRIVLTQGPEGATLYLEGSQVANLATVTQGWSSLTTAITLGSSSNTGHANDRSPLWGRLDQIEVWQGQMALSDVQACAAAAQSLLWKYPSDFVGGATDINIASHASPQAAMDAAHAAGRYLYQAEGDATYYSGTLSGDDLMDFRPGCKGLINVRLRFPNSMGSGGFKRIINCSNDSGAMGTGHGDPFAASGGWKFIGCKFDGNARNQDWHPKSGEPGFTFHGFDHQHRHALMLRNTSVQQTFTLDACDWFDGQGDGASITQRQVVTAKSCRFYGFFRGPLVANAMDFTINFFRSECLDKSVFGSLNQGTGLHDIEPFGGSGGSWVQRDCWSQGDFDDNGGSTGASALFVNSHSPGGGHMLLPNDIQATTNPYASWTARYCTFGYHSSGGNGGGNFPASWWQGFEIPDPGLVFEDCVFLANGDPYNYHESYIVTPSNSKKFYIRYIGNGTQTRLWTMRNCQFRVKNLPGGLATSNVRAIEFETAMSTSQSVELDGLTIDAAFADNPFIMGGITVRHRNVLHERTLDTTPWTGAGAEVPI